MNWDAQSDRAAIRHYSDWCPDGIQEAHRRGARWQREALRSDEAILRALNAEEPRVVTRNLADWSEQSVARMRRALAAAIADDNVD